MQRVHLPTSSIQELLGVSSVIQSDSLFAKDLKSKTEQAVQDTIVATNIIEGFKNPHQSAAYLKNHASFPLEYVWIIIVKYLGMLTRC
jgi:nucleoporin p58/p45